MRATNRLLERFVGAASAAKCSLTGPLPARIIVPPRGLAPASHPCRSGFSRDWGLVWQII